MAGFMEEVGAGAGETPSSAVVLLTGIGHALTSVYFSSSRAHSVAVALVEIAAIEAGPAAILAATGAVGGAQHAGALSVVSALRTGSQTSSTQLLEP